MSYDFKNCFGTVHNFGFSVTLLFLFGGGGICGIVPRGLLSTTVLLSRTADWNLIDCNFKTPTSLGKVRKTNFRKLS